MTLFARIYQMIKPVLFTAGGIKTHSITKRQYVKVHMTRTANYIAFRNWWNSTLQGKVLTIPFSNKFKLQLGAISKDTEDMLTVYLIPA